MSDKQIPLQALTADLGDFYREKNPVCPHCGTVYNIADNDAWELYDADTTPTLECLHCELPFMVTVETSYSFSTDDQPDYES